MKDKKDVYEKPKLQQYKVLRKVFAQSLPTIPWPKKRSKKSKEK